MNKKKYKGILLVILIVIGLNAPKLLIVNAEPSNTATLRIIATGDLHGQVTAYNNETYLQTPKEGLSKISTIVNQKRNEIGANNTLLVDAGDFLYDYASNFFYDNDKNLTQPIMRAMSLMKYDYITLGNHEFDYPWAYLLNQLESSELLNKVVVSNMLWHDSGESVFSPSAIITKQLTTTNGDTVTVKVGIVGANTNFISSRRGDYVNEIDVVNSYDNIVAESNRLKSSENVDLVVVILHGGIGTSTTPKTSENIGYALTKVASVDAVVTAHSHELFPDINETYPASSNVNTATGCINGKPVLATSSHAQALGTIDLKLAVASDGSVILKNGTAGAEYVKADTVEDRSITDMFRSYASIIKDGADPSSYKISNGITYHNYDTVLQDSNLYQLLNNAKIDYGLSYVKEYLPAYSKLPVIACTRNKLDNNEFYISMKDTLSADKIAGILSESTGVRSAGYLQMYQITGKNLREWIEYTASMYATEGTTFGSILQRYVSKNRSVSTLLQDAYIYNWGSQYIFDGVSYTIDLTKKARYKLDGTMISSRNKRVTSLHYNGMAVTDSQKFVIVTDSGNQIFSFIPAEATDSIKTGKDNETGKNITLNYIKKLNAFGTISVIADHNWSLKAGKSYTFLLGVPKTIAGDVSKYTWSNGSAAETTSYSFIKGSLPAAAQKINIVAAQGRTEINNTPVPVIISAASKYTIREIKYLKGKLTKSSDSKWNQANVVENNTFNTTENGVYTIRVKDGKDKYALSYVTVDRYDAKVLPSPKMDKLTNRNTIFTGTATPNSMIHITIGENNYSATVTGNGTFKADIKPQKAFAPISAYAEVSGKKSASVTASVRKTGPDTVQLNKIWPGDTNITGTADDHTFVYALIWPTIYVGKGQTKAYLESDFYNSEYKIVETDITMDEATGAYRITVPSIRSNKKVYVYTTDRIGATSKPAILIP